MTQQSLARPGADGYPLYDVMIIGGGPPRAAREEPPVES